MKDLITPGEILIEEYLNPMGISQNAMPRAIGVSPRAINEIVLGRRSITPPMSIRFGVFFGSEPAVRHRLHQGLRVLRLEDIVRFLHPDYSWDKLIRASGPIFSCRRIPVSPDSWSRRWNRRKNSTIGPVISP